MTKGEQRVRTTFNPANDGYVDQIKQKTAELINLVNETAPKIPSTDEEIGEFKRLQSLSMTQFENAAMWAVKMATL